MKKINEKTKVTLTLGQIKRLVKESHGRLVRETDEMEETISDPTEAEQIVISYKSRPRVHSFAVGGWDSVSKVKLMDALSNPKLRVFMVTDADGDQYVFGADSFNEYCEIGKSHEDTSNSIYEPVWDLEVGESVTIRYAMTKDIVKRIR